MATTTTITAIPTTTIPHQRFMWGQGIFYLWACMVALFNCGVALTNFIRLAATHSSFYYGDIYVIYDSSYAFSPKTNAFWLLLISSFMTSFISLFMGFSLWIVRPSSETNPLLKKWVDVIHAFAFIFLGLLAMGCSGILGFVAGIMSFVSALVLIVIAWRTKALPLNEKIMVENNYNTIIPTLQRNVYNV